MKIVISTTVSMPIYEQIINQIRDAVVSGELKAGVGKGAGSQCDYDKACL